MAKLTPSCYDIFMKNIILFLCLTAGLAADELQKSVTEEVQIDQSVKDRFSKARKQGWDFSSEMEKTQLENTPETLEYKLPRDYHPMQKSEEMSKSFRNDLTPTERAKMIDRLNERDHTHWREAQKQREDVQKMQEQAQRHKSRH